MASNKKIAVILSGCGRMDGSEIHEAAMLLLAIDMGGMKYQCFAPNIEQYRVKNHITGDIMSIEGDRNNRNVLVESARIARGDILDIKQFKAKDYDAIVFPGGVGAVSNLCTYEEKGVDCCVELSISAAINDAYNEKIVIGAMCIAPVLIAKVLGNKGIVVTIGNDVKTAADIKKMGAVHMDTPAMEVCVDEKHKIITTPAYMKCKSIKEVHFGANKFVMSIMKMLGLTD